MHIDRRTLLISTAAIVGGISVGVLAERQGWWTPAIIGTPDPDAAIARVSRTGEAALIRAYDAALSEATPAPGVLQQLQTYRAQHLDHLVALGGDERDISDAPSPGQSDPEDPQAAPLVPPLPPDPSGIPGYFAGLEQQHTQLLTTGVRISSDGEQARLLALIVSSETTHEVGWSRG